MARRKRNSPTLEKANRRLESLRSISTTLDFGDGLSIAAYETAINDMKSKLAAYNTALSAVDSLADAVNQAEQAVQTMSEKMLLCVGGRYGRTSKEYGMAGGSRRYRRRWSASESSPALSHQPELQPESTNGSANGAISN
ncbi:MAG: hypothetical protein VKK04_07820 [Synechococcales bacterium]|nr:hypothetical protein [Synechococcales bacterium]